MLPNSLTQTEDLGKLKLTSTLNYQANVTDKMRIGELADQAGVTPRTIRYYESLGLMGPSEREGRGFRYYTEAQLVRLRKIEVLKGLGLSLEEIRSVIDLYFNDGMEIDAKHKVLSILISHLQETEEKIEALQKFRVELQSNIAKVKQHIEQAQS